MDKIKKYQDIVIAYLQEHAKRKPANMSDIDSYIIADKESNHFQLLQTGWQNDRYVFTIVFHFAIKNEKIWLLRNITEREIVDTLMEQGVTKEDIVLGFTHPMIRAQTGFAAY
jgi:PhoPQ-activated pathogenicity-related protein